MMGRLVDVLVAFVFALAGSLACSSDSETPAGHEGGPCYGNGTCDTGLVCRGGGGNRTCEAAIDGGRG